MLQIEVRRRKKPVIWNLGEKFPSVKPQDVVLLRADGKELAIVLENFHNVPYTSSQVCQVWVGEWAKQIFANLPTVSPQPAPAPADAEPPDPAKKEGARRSARIHPDDVRHYAKGAGGE